MGASASPTVGFSLGASDQQRVQRLAQRYAHGNRSAWLRQALDLFEEKALFDTLSRVQARGEQRTAELGLDRQALADLLADAAASPQSTHAERIADLLTQFDVAPPTVGERSEVDAFLKATDDAVSPTSAGSG